MTNNELITLHEGPMYGAAFSVLGHPDLAQEAVQNATVTLLKRGKTIRPKTARSYLCSAAIYEARNLGRRSSVHKRRQPAVAEPEPDPSNTPDSPLERIIHAEEARRKIDRFRALPHRHRQVLYLSAIGLSYDEISVVCELSPAQVNRAAYRGRRALKD